MSDEIDPLLPQPPDELHVPGHLTGEDRIRWVFEAAVDHVNFNAMAWPARDRSGTLQPPPDEHVLDGLARANDLVDEERALSTISAGTVTVVTDLPSCDLCNQEARYDATIEVSGRSGGAFLCPACYEMRGSGSLGASGDVYLMRIDEVSDWVRQRYDAVAASIGKPPLR